MNSFCLGVSRQPVVYRDNSCVVLLVLTMLFEASRFISMFGSLQNMWQTTVSLWKKWLFHPVMFSQYLSGYNNMKLFTAKHSTFTMLDQIPHLSFLWDLTLKYNENVNKNLWHDLGSLVWISTVDLWEYEGHSQILTLRRSLKHSPQEGLSCGSSESRWELDGLEIWVESAAGLKYEASRYLWWETPCLENKKKH